MPLLALQDFAKDFDGAGLFVRTQPDQREHGAQAQREIVAVPAFDALATRHVNDPRASSVRFWAIATQATAMRAVGFDLRRDGMLSGATGAHQLIQLHDTCRRFSHPAFRKIEPRALDEDAGGQPVPAACVTEGLRLIEQRIGLLGVANARQRSG